MGKNTDHLRSLHWGDQEMGVREELPDVMLTSVCFQPEMMVRERLRCLF